MRICPIKMHYLLYFGQHGQTKLTLKIGCLEGMGFCFSPSIQIHLRAFADLGTVLKSQRDNSAKIMKIWTNTFGESPGLRFNETRGCCSSGCSELETAQCFIAIDALARKFIACQSLQMICVCRVSRALCWLQACASDLLNLGFLLIPIQQ